MPSVDKRGWWTWLYDELWWLPGTDWRWAQVYGVVTMCIVVAVLSFDRKTVDAELPAPGSLHVVEGVVRSAERGDGKIDFYLNEWQTPFRYWDKAGAIDLVARELRPGRAASVSVDGSTFKASATDVVNIYALSLDGAAVRTFAQVRDSWIDTDRVEPLLLFALSLGAVAFFATAMYERIRQERSPRR